MTWMSIFFPTRHPIFLLTIWQNREFSLALDYHSARLKSIKRQKQKKTTKKEFCSFEEEKKSFEKKSFVMNSLAWLQFLCRTNSSASFWDDRCVITTGSRVRRIESDARKNLHFSDSLLQIFIATIAFLLQ